MNLYFVQDDDRPLHVVAESFEKALERWRANVLAENETMLPEDDDCNPAGISFVAEADQFILPDTQFPIIKP